MQPSDEIVSALQELYAASPDELDALVSYSPAVSMIGTDPGGGADTRDGWLEFLRESYGSGRRLEGERPQGWSAGDVGFAFDRPTLLLDDGGRVVTRLTAIFHREGGRWKLVHAHFSVGVPTEQVVERG